MQEITDSERKMFELLRAADAVFVLDETGLRPFSWIRGLSKAPATVNVKFAEGPDGKRMVRHLTVRMGITEREFAEAMKREGKS